MPLTAWRLVKAKHASTAFDGEGARRYGGRWNLRGTAVVYLGGSLSLAALEIFVHLTAEDARLAFSAIQVDIPDGVSIGTLEPQQLPENWREEPPPDACKALGTTWAKAGKTTLLRVPSVIVPSEYNFLLNPAHRGARRLKIHSPQPFGFDDRMWK
jgi:RES domain-containing protein